MMKIGVTTSVFVNFSLSDIITMVAHAGYDGIDIWGGRPHAYRQDHSPEDLQQLKQLVRQHELQVCSFMPAFFRYPHSFSNPNLAVRRDTLNYMRLCADNAAELEAEILLLVPGRSVHGQTVEEAFSLLTESLHQVCEYCRQYDFKLGIEPSNPAVSDLVATYKDALRIIEALQWPSLGVVLDSGHMYVNQEDPGEAVAQLGPKLLQMHVNDNDGVQQQNQIPGDGTFDFAALLKTLQQQAFDGFLSVELGWQYTLNPQQAVSTSYQRIRRYLDSIGEAV